MTTQDDIFLNSEGDRYFERNSDLSADLDLSTDIPSRIVSLYNLRPTNLIEIGALNGFRVAALAESLGAHGTALDPSRLALQDGKARFPNIDFLHGTSAEVPTKNTYDLVIVNAVLHWVDRTTLADSVAEIDRLVAADGFLIIGDFLPSNRLRVHYHHLAKASVYTYKQNYAAIFEALGCYHTLCLLTTTHGATKLVPEPDEYQRWGVWLLRKHSDANYYETRKK